MRKCKILEEEKKKSNRTLITICIVFLILILILTIKCFEINFIFLNKINWSAVGSIGTVFAIIAAILISRKEIKESVKNQIIATELSNLKENLNNEVNKYVEFSNELFKNAINVNFLRLDIVSNVDINNNLIFLKCYNSFINCIIQNIIYYYGNYNGDRPIFNNFLTELNRINSIMNERISSFLKLTDDMIKLNKEYLKLYSENKLFVNGKEKEIFQKAEEIVDNYYKERQKLMLSDEDINKIKQTALDVIEEKKYYIENDLNRTYKD